MLHVDIEFLHSLSPLARIPGLLRSFQTQLVSHFQWLLFFAFFLEIPSHGQDGA